MSTEGIRKSPIETYVVFISADFELILRKSIKWKRLKCRKVDYCLCPSLILPEKNCSQVRCCCNKHKMATHLTLFCHILSHSFIVCVSFPGSFTDFFCVVCVPDRWFRHASIGVQLVSRETLLQGK